MSKQKAVATDGVFFSADNIKAISGRCTGCGEVHYLRITYLDNWKKKIDFISEQTYYQIHREQCLARLN